MLLLVSYPPSIYGSMFTRWPFIQFSLIEKSFSFHFCFLSHFFRVSFHRQTMRLSNVPLKDCTNFQSSDHKFERLKINEFSFFVDRCDEITWIFLFCSFSHSFFPQNHIIEMDSVIAQSQIREMTFVRKHVTTQFLRCKWKHSRAQKTIFFTHCRFEWDWIGWFGYIGCQAAMFTIWNDAVLAVWMYGIRLRTHSTCYAVVLLCLCGVC